MKKILFLSMTMMVLLVGCGKDTPVSITFEAAKTTLTKGESTNLTVTVTGNSNWIR